MTPRAGLLFIDMLCAEARAQAMRNILATDRYHLSKQIKDAGEIARANIDQAINDQHHINKIVRRHRHIKRLEQDETYLRAYIEGNFCEFDAEGRYHPMMTPAVNLN